MTGSVTNNAKKDPTNADLQEQITELTGTIEVLTASVAELTSAWNNAKGITSFIKWASALGASLAVIYAAIHGAK